MTRPSMVCCAPGKMRARNGDMRSRVMAWKKSFKAPPTNIATAKVSISDIELIFIIKLDKTNQKSWKKIEASTTKWQMSKCVEQH